MPLITYPQECGQVAVVMPVDQSMSIEEIVAKTVPSGVEYRIIESFDFENDYFNAYEFDKNAGAVINIEKAKAIHLDKLRAARAPKLAALDIDYSRADESGDAAKKAEIAAEKQALRDVTKVELPSDLPSLKEFWPAVLGPRPSTQP